MGVGILHFPFTDYNSPSSHNMTQYLEAPNSNAKLLLLQSLRLHDHLLNPSGHENSKRQFKKIKLKKLKTKETEKSPSQLLLRIRHALFTIRINLQHACRSFSGYYQSS